MYLSLFLATLLLSAVAQLASELERINQEYARGMIIYSHIDHIDDHLLSHWLHLFYISPLCIFNNQEYARAG